MVPAGQSTLSNSFHLILVWLTRFIYICQIKEFGHQKLPEVGGMIFTIYKSIAIATPQKDRWIFLPS